MPTFDLHFQLLDPTAQRAGAAFRFGFVPPVLAVSGVQKLLDRFLKRFCTRKGSNPVDPSEGTNFPLLVGGNVDAVADLQADVLQFVDDAATQLRAADRASPGLTADERLGSASLLLFQQVGPLDVEFWVEVVSVSGRRARALIPYAAG